jgi:hypothetical protein
MVLICGIQGERQNGRDTITCGWSWEGCELALGTNHLFNL